MQRHVHYAHALTCCTNGHFGSGLSPPPASHARRRVAKLATTCHISTRVHMQRLWSTARCEGEAWPAGSYQCSPAVLSLLRQYNDAVGVRKQGVLGSASSWIVRFLVMSSQVQGWFRPHPLREGTQYQEENRHAPHSERARASIERRTSRASSSSEGDSHASRGVSTSE